MIRSKSAGPDEKKERAAWISGGKALLEIFCSMECGREKQERQLH